MIRFLEQQPPELEGKHYRDIPLDYHWIRMEHNGKPYAVMGVQIYQGVAFIFWKILGFTVGALKELKRKDAPELRAICKAGGATYARCSTTDPNEPDFEKMTAFMGFNEFRKIAAVRL